MNRNHKLLWSSSYDRGLEHLLRMWPDIKQAVPDATLTVCYGWDLFDKITRGNEERRKWKEEMVKLMEQVDIIHLGRIGKKELIKQRKEAGILAYPSHFAEIFCISVVEAMREGCVPVTTDIAALKETNTGGVLVEGDISKEEVKKEYLKKLLEVMQDHALWEKLSRGCEKEAKGKSWNHMAQKWQDAFVFPKNDIKVSIVTPSVRQGWWNSMAHNIASQNYKNVEWVIVDDYKDNRQAVADKYAKEYNLDIKYVRGKERDVKRTYGLVNANNTGYKVATGEIIIILQDFMYMPDNGIEQIVDLYRKNPDALIAPTDHLYEPKIKPNINSEDWFDGSLDFKGELIWKNNRNIGMGIRESDSPYEFEQNYCAIPKSIIEALNGWYEFIDEGLGFDNTEFAYRALKSGYRLLVDDTNVGYGINHWEALKKTDVTLSIGRHRNLSNPRFAWETKMIEEGRLPLVRDEELEKKVHLKYDIPGEIDDNDVVKWLRKNEDRIVASWEGIL